MPELKKGSIALLKIVICLAFIGLIVLAFSTKDEHTMLSCYAVSGFLFFFWLMCCVLKWLFKKEEKDKKNVYQNDKIKIDITDREKKILRFQMISFLLSFGLALYPSIMILSPVAEKCTIYLWFGSWLLSAFSSIFCVCLLNWKNLFSVLSVALFFPPVWFLMCGSGVAFSSKQTSDTEVSLMFLAGIILGFLIYFGLILKAELVSKIDWKKLL